MKRKAFFVYMYPKDSDTHVYLELDSIENLEQNDTARGRQWFLKKKIVDGIGSIIAVELEGDSVLFSKRPVILARWPHKDDVAGWILKKRAVDYQKKIDTLAKEDWLAEQLMPLKDAYRMTSNRHDRAAMLAEIIRIVTS